MESPKRKTAKRVSGGKTKAKVSKSNLPILIGGGVAVGMIVLWFVFAGDSLARVHRDLLATVKTATVILDKVATTEEADVAAGKLDQLSSKIETIATRIDKLESVKPEEEQRVKSTVGIELIQAIEAEKASWRTLRDSNRSSALLGTAQANFVMVQSKWMERMIRRVQPGSPNGK